MNQSHMTNGTFLPSLTLVVASLLVGCANSLPGKPINSAATAPSRNFGLPGLRVVYVWPDFKSGDSKNIYSPIGAAQANTAAGHIWKGVELSCPVEFKKGGIEVIVDAVNVGQDPTKAGEDSLSPSQRAWPLLIIQPYNDRMSCSNSGGCSHNLSVRESLVQSGVTTWKQEFSEPVRWQSPPFAVRYREYAESLCQQAARAIAGA